MTKKELSKIYNANEVEGKIYQAWKKAGFFSPDNLSGKRSKAFSIAMPPPNATGVLHAGHAVMVAVQDIVSRYQRMAGKKVLWLPGTDHAAIATQTVVEKLLAKEGKTKYDLGRENFLKRVDEFIAGSRHTIKEQIKKLGASCDWSRERFTLDEGLSAAVAEAFVRMHDDGLIYRGYRIVNWCPRCESTLADDEVEYKEQPAKFYYLKYGPVIIGTARPETKFLDKTIVVHPDDPRYKHLHGKTMEVEWIEGRVKANVIADKIVDKDFGTGAMTITPAHSFEDFELAQKYHLPVVQIIDEKGNFTKAAGSYAGKNARQSRDEIISLLQSKGLVERIDEKYIHNLSMCYRCGTPVEPLPSKQWFVAVNKPIKKLGGKTLKEKAIEVVKKGEIEIIPNQFKKIYFHWLNDLHDWCISRQIWFGHRIPVWYNKRQETSDKRQAPDLERQSEKIYVGIKPPTGKEWKQDPDTLDTWFSSGLWTFSTLGWPAKTKDLKTFHPTSLMETAYDILFFWVARMILMSNYLMGEIPFKTVYLHGLIRDINGEKMSKSKPETCIDPVEMIKKYGADAMRLSLVIGNTPGNDSKLYEQKISSYRNFTNKLWNISRFILMTVAEPKLIIKAPKPQTLADQWILTELNQLILDVKAGLDQYQFSQTGEKLYEFTWSKLADWFLEISKIEKNKDDILNYILQTLLKLWHPFMPYVTEEIWSNILSRPKENNYSRELLMIQEFPKAAKIKSGVAKDFNLIQQIIISIRNLRAENKVEPAKKIKAIISAGAKAVLISKQAEIIKSLARLSELIIERKTVKPKDSAVAVAAGVEIYLPLSDIIDVAQQKSALIKEINQLQDYLEKLETRLANREFLAKAPVAVVSKEKAKLAAERERLSKLEKNLSSL